MSEVEEETQQTGMGEPNSAGEESQQTGMHEDENTNMHNLDTEKELVAVEETREKQAGEKRNREAIGYVKIEVGDYIIYARDWSIVKDFKEMKAGRITSLSSDGSAHIQEIKINRKEFSFHFEMEEEGFENP